jgi:predicted enzyme related to lactoylglutathione lyase
MMSTAFETNGAFSWTELMTSDVAAARKFYGQLLGWDFQDMPMQQGGTYTVISAGGQKIGGIMHTPPGAEGMPPTWGSYITVDDVDTRAAAVKKLGGKIVIPPTDIPNVGRFCVIHDPQGATISLITYSMPAQP